MGAADTNGLIHVAHSGDWIENRLRSGRWEGGRSGKVVEIDFEGIFPSFFDQQRANW